MAKLVPVVYLVAHEPTKRFGMVTIRRRTSGKSFEWVVLTQEGIGFFPAGTSLREKTHGPYETPEEALAAFDANEVEWMDGLGVYERVDQA